MPAPKGSSLLPSHLREPYLKAAASGATDLRTEDGAWLHATYEDLADRIEHEVGTVGIAGLLPARRQWWLIHRLNGALAGDGASIGLLHNNPELIEAGLTYLSPLELPHTNELLRYARSIIPPHLNPNECTNEFQHWAFEELTEEQHERLSELCDLAEPYAKGSFNLCARIVTDNPDEFFTK